MKPHYMDQLKRLAPAIAFSVSRKADEYFQWDGDGPDPAEEGYVAYDVTVAARVIDRGEIMEGSASLGGSYWQPSDDIVAEEIGGYLPQMLEEAATDLLKDNSIIEPHSALWNQAKAAIAYMKKVMRERWEAQQAKAS